MTDSSSDSTGMETTILVQNETDCGRCKLIDSAKETYFPCTHKEYGCEQVLPYDYFKRHESTCEYRSCKCMAKECNWEGLKVDLEKHFNNKHKSCIQLDYVRIPAIGENNNDPIVISVESVLFIIEYNYHPGGNLEYKISYVSSYIKGAVYLITKVGEAVGKGLCFYLDDPASKYEVLNAEDIRDCTLYIRLKTKRYNSRLVNYTLIDSHKCSKCEGYLIPQPFNVQPFGTICGSCAEVGSECAVPSTLSLPENLKSANFPCRWKFCHFVTNSDKMFDHEKDCRFRLYKCFIDVKCDFMDLADLKRHLTDVHTVKYFEDKYILEETAPSLLFTIKNKTFISVNVEVLTRFLFRISVKKFGPRTRIPIYIQCEHDHCNIKSRMFCVIQEFRFTREDLPPCFSQKAFSIVVSMS